VTDRSDKLAALPISAAVQASPATDGSSALAASRVKATPSNALHVVPDPDGPDGPDAPDGGLQRIQDSSGPAWPAPPVGLLLRGLLEVLSGWRPASQLALRMSPEIAADLLTRPRRRTAERPPYVQRLRVLRVSDDAVEACAVLRRAHRCGALAMRLEHGERGWLVTRLQIG
jgi:hypothetical protein